MSNDQDVKDIIAQLQDLQIVRGRLIDTSQATLQR
jgi:hypothetical protein